jgi:hypothetical protein
MLRPVALVEQFNAIERELPDRWGTGQLRLTVADAGRCARAAGLLGPVNPGRRGTNIRFAVSRLGAGVGPDGIRRLLRRLDQEGIHGELELVSAEEAPEQELRRGQKLAEAWAVDTAALPPDWTDIYAEIRLDSTDYLDRAALLLSPLNPARYGGPTGFRFRCARNFGYGVSAEMARRCLQRCDDEGITGEVELLRVLSDTFPVATQGPVWYVGGRSV